MKECGSKFDFAEKLRCTKLKTCVSRLLQPNIRSVLLNIEPK